MTHAMVFTAYDREQVSDVDGKAGRNAPVYGADDESKAAGAAGAATPFGNQAHTVSGLVRFPSGNFSGPRQWLLRLGQATSGSLHWLWNGGTKIQFGRWCGESVGASQIKVLPAKVFDGEEHAIVTVFDGSVLRLFVDGELTTLVQNSIGHVHDCQCMCI